ncbi:MAG TPA: 3-hydroxyacyl-CoA dehydrogenase NAD-binding domain-containing protein [Planctomycetaceae bacterium]|nr:3-hydroxyacyl-CoA dehydrogenase NAD-binding domain-containing protein [Planctomycetaceae bacterium]
MTFQRIAVIGAGTMGRGIAECAAAHGLAVSVVEVSHDQRERALEQVRKSVERGIQRGKLSAKSPEDVLGRITWDGDFGRTSEAELVIEAVPELEDVKIEVFERLDAICPAEVILASNTSSISITRLCSITRRPDRVVGMHFFNPVPIMQPVEIVRGLQTSDATVEATHRLAEQMGKKSFTVQDSPGFVVNRVLMPLINEAFFTLHEGVADAATIDGLTKLGLNHPMGPLELADLVGLDVCLSILRVLHEELGDPKFRPCPLLVRLVDAGRLGRKTGRGVYEYGEK